MLLELYIKSYREQFGKLDRPYWNYEDGCLMKGLWDLYEAVGDEHYKETVRSFLDRCIGADGQIRGYDPGKYSLDQLPGGRNLLLLYLETGEERYKHAADRLFEQLKEQPRTRCGSFWHKKIYPWQIWLDGLYMALPFYLMYERLCGDGAGYEDAVCQFRNARKYLFDGISGLYGHGWDEKKAQFWCDPETGRSPCFWSRSMGWLAMALADCYELMPRDRIGLKEQLRWLWAEALEGLLEYQDQESGLFWQLTDQGKREGNYLETSASAMIAYSLLKGYRLGVFGESQLKAAIRVLGGIESHKVYMKRGIIHIGGICLRAGLGPDNRRDRDGSRAYYLSEPVVEDEQKGVSAVMMAYSQYLCLNRQKGNLENLAAAGINDIWNMRSGGVN